MMKIRDFLKMCGNDYLTVIIWYGTGEDDVVSYNDDKINTIYSKIENRYLDKYIDNFAISNGVVAICTR